MMNRTKQSKNYIASLSDFIFNEYNLSAISITPAKRGFFGETWQLDTSDCKYFLKLVYVAAHQSIYERSFAVIEHLCRHGIDFISKAIKTTDSRLFTRFDGAVLGMFEWIEGENRETNATKSYEYEMLAKVYTVPTYGVQISVEDFSGISADTFFEQWKVTNDTQVLSLLEKNRTKLEYRAERLKHFSDLCKNDTTNFFITHGDAGGNFIVSNGKHFIVDWDNSVLAPPERDAWEMGFQDWAQRLFQEKLRQNGINYNLRPERLAYYAYHVFFYCLTWFTRCSTAEEIEGFFNAYGSERIEYADNYLRH